MDTRYVLNLAKYQGPIEKLLELIESRELAVTEISMAEVTDDFLKYLARISEDYRNASDAPIPAATKEEYLRLLADFIVIASRLVFIKSKALMPDMVLGEDEESQIKDLEDRLKLYQELKPAMKALGIQWREAKHEFSRDYFLHIKGLLLAIRAAEGDQGDFFYPGPKLDSATLIASLKNILALTPAPVVEETKLQERIVSLEATIKNMIARIEELKETTFRGMTTGGTRMDAVVSFLAILHLAREQLVSLEQEGAGSDIIIRKTPTAASQATATTDGTGSQHP
jgi:segregation and condensation protein A